MPLAAIIPAALGVASLIASNGQQKAAAKNNTNQQNAAVDNAKQANTTAQQQLAALVGSSPSPFAGQTVRKPTGGYGMHLPTQLHIPQPSAAPSLMRPPDAGTAPSMAGAVLGGNPAGAGYRMGPHEPYPGHGMRIL